MADFGGATFKKVFFKEASLNNTNFEGIGKSTTLSEVNFEKVNLKMACFRETILTRVKFIRSILKDVDFHSSDLSEAEFENCSYSPTTNFEQANLDKTIFKGSLRQANFRKSNHKEADFKDADTSLALF
jgi:uncharacterized protein YjbI with pentapeptide repeats